MTKRPRKPSRPLLTDDAPVQSRRIRRRDPRQPELAFDPMPDRIEPCLAKLVSQPPAGDDWSYEIKWDGYRLAIHFETNRIRILTRGGHDWTHRFPSIVAAAQEMLPLSAILDGEAVVLDDQGRSDFGMLQNSLGGRGGKKPAGAAILYAFDLLYLDGHDLTGVECSSRRKLLEGMLTDDEGAIRFSHEIEADPETFLKAACQHGLEGIIAKHRDRPYRSGRTGDWLKIKCVESDAFVVVGYEPSTTDRGAVGSLVLAALRGSDYVHVGSVGTGFTRAVARELKQTLDVLKTRTPAIRLPGKQLVLTSPTLIAEIEYRGWTNDGSLRHASYKGLRDRQDNADIYRLA